jgi:hypothetical protein
MSAEELPSLLRFLEMVEAGKLKRDSLPEEFRDLWSNARHRNLIDLSMIPGDPCWLTSAGRSELSVLRERAHTADRTPPAPATGQAEEAGAPHCPESPLDDPMQRLKEEAAEEAQRREAEERRLAPLFAVQREEHNLRFYCEGAGGDVPLRGFAEQVAKYLAALRAAGLGERFDALQAGDDPALAVALELYCLCDQGDLDGATARLGESKALGRGWPGARITDALKRKIPDAISAPPIPSASAGNSGATDEASAARSPGGEGHHGRPTGSAARVGTVENSNAPPEPGRVAQPRPIPENIQAIPDPAFRQRATDAWRAASQLRRLMAQWESWFLELKTKGDADPGLALLIYEAVMACVRALCALGVNLEPFSQASADDLLKRFPVPPSGVLDPPELKDPNWRREIESLFLRDDVLTDPERRQQIRALTAQPDWLEHLEIRTRVGELLRAGTWETKQRHLLRDVGHTLQTVDWRQDPGYRRKTEELLGQDDWCALMAELFQFLNLLKTAPSAALIVPAADGASGRTEAAVQGPKAASGVSRGPGEVGQGEAPDLDTEVGINFVLAEVYRAAAGFATAIWDSRPVVRGTDRDPFDYIPSLLSRIDVAGSHLSVALRRPDYTTQGWHDALQRSGFSPAIQAALRNLYDAVHWAQQPRLRDGQRQPASLRTAFHRLNEGLRQLLPELSTLEQVELSPVVRDIGARWNWDPDAGVAEGANPTPSVSANNPPSVYRLLELIDDRPHDTKYSDIPVDLRDALRIALHRGLAATDAIEQGGPVVAVADGSAEAAERLAAHRASLDPTYWLTSAGRCELALHRESRRTERVPGGPNSGETGNSTGGGAREGERTDLDVKRGAEVKGPPSPLQHDILDALRELKAVDCEKRATASAIADKVGGDATEQSVKGPLADLKARSLVDSRTGRKGGSWLTQKGLAYINTLRPKK